MKQILSLTLILFISIGVFGQVENTRSKVKRKYRDVEQIAQTQQPAGFFKGIVFTTNDENPVAGAKCNGIDGTNKGV
jgi:hypothetical protein